MMSKVKTYLGHNVPDGATHYHKGNSTYIESFYLLDGENVMFSTIGNTKGWERSNMYMPPVAIELPEEETKPDWDSAPTDTAVWIDDNNPNSGNDFSGWFEFDKHNERYSSSDRGGNLSTLFRDKYTVHHRPEIKPEVWDGKGLPPVGAVCEMVCSQYNDNEAPEYGHDGLKVEIVSYKNNMAVFIYENDGEWYASLSDNYKHFRPLKTQEEKDREAFIEWVSHAIGGIHKDDFNKHEISACLYEMRSSMPKANSGR